MAEGIGVNQGTGVTLQNRQAIARRIAKFFHSGDIINLGVGIPLLVGNYIEDGVLVHCENGCIGCGPLVDESKVSPNMSLESFRNAGSQPFFPLPGAIVFDSATSYAIIRTGILKATVLGAFEVAENGDMANWYSETKVSGMGGAMDLCKAETVIVATMQTQKDGSPKLIKKCTLPLTCSKKVSYVVTEMGMFQFIDHKMYLKEIREGHTLEEIKNTTEADFIIADDLKTNVAF